mmetsp:Transcript_23104/g.91645  ORF Transcript_23104/g.91645 Transcript_23104/m.91645 type:complete len:270 (+) Transcript_23104:19-828(+)
MTIPVQLPPDARARAATTSPPVCRPTTRKPENPKTRKSENPKTRNPGRRGRHDARRRPCDERALHGDRAGQREAGGGHPRRAARVDGRADGRGNAVADGRGNVVADGGGRQRDAPDGGAAGTRGPAGRPAGGGHRAAVPGVPRADRVSELSPDGRDAHIQRDRARCLGELLRPVPRGLLARLLSHPVLRRGPQGHDAHLPGVRHAPRRAPPHRLMCALLCSVDSSCEPTLRCCVCATRASGPASSSEEEGSEPPRIVMIGLLCFLESLT